MPSNYTVEGESTRAREYESAKGGTLVVWNVPIKDVGVVELHKKPGNDPPTVGSVVFANIKDQEFNGEPFKRMYVEQQGGGGGGGAGGGGRGKSPEEQRSIERMNAAKIAADVLQGVYGNISDEQYAEEFNRVGEMVHAFVSKGRA